MLSEQFYDILDKELVLIIAENQQDILQKNLKQINQQKGYAFLIWFLKMYSPNKMHFREYITDGKDDSSCDIIFSAKENGEEIFYVVQSKWNVKPKAKEGNQPEKISSDEVKKAILDFESIFRKDKRKGKNELFNQRLEELHKHRVEKGGLVKFIFVGLLPHNEEVNEYVRNFEANYSPCKLEIMDIERLKRDYIEFKFKQIEVNNPLSYKYSDPNEDKIILPIERLENSMGKGDHLKIEKPYDSYILIIKPKTIFDLFEKYKFSLFFNNVRNPLPESNYNQAIVNTLQKKPEMFWYFNNGITAISKIIKPLGFDAQVMELRGLQVINGAQTVYSIYSAYKNAGETQREIMDSDAKICLRLIRSNNNEMNLEITRYTNSQNPMEARDFWANDEVQIRLQEESFKTKYWYAKRRGEFREVPEGVEVIDNTEFAIAYARFYIVSPLVLQRDFYFLTSKYIFPEINNENNEIYVAIFNTNVNLEKMLVSLFMKRAEEIFAKNSKRYMLNSFSQRAMFLPLSKLVFQRYINQKYASDANMNRLIKKYYENDIQLLVKIFYFIDLEIAKQYLKIVGQDTPSFEDVKEYFEKLPFSAQDIENLDLDIDY